MKKIDKLKKSYLLELEENVTHYRPLLVIITSYLLSPQNIY